MILARFAFQACSFNHSDIFPFRTCEQMIDHDKNVGELLDVVDELKIADNTIVKMKVLTESRR
jgi:hypothetical protein